MLKRGRGQALEDFHGKLGKLTFFDPACGCGNFLVIAYRELRELETAVLKELHPEQRVTDIGLYTKVNVDQFYGIEIEEFPARIAEVAMWMTDHIENVRLSAVFGEAYARIPLTKSPNIKNADALEVNWDDVLPSASCSYVFGNPPFIGAKFQSEHQRLQLRRIAALGGSGGSLDYVCAWFIKAAAYVKESDGRIAFVATNSITQGEQVAQLWPLLFNRYGLEIAFAHRTFAWISDARGSAQVHCVIVGLVKRSDEPKEKRLFSYSEIDGDPIESLHSALSPYLFDASHLRDRHLVIREESKSLSGAPAMVIGSKPIDGGYLIFNDEEKAEFLSREPGARRFMRPFIGGVEYTQNRSRWILALQEASPAELGKMPAVMERLKAVREYRLGKIAPRKQAGSEPKIPGTSARSLADKPTQFHVTVIPKKAFLAVPENTVSTREYPPLGWLEPPIIPSNKIRFIKDADLWQFAVLTSRMHVAWLRFIGGRIKSDFQYSIGIVYNPFPWPPQQTDKVRDKIRALAQSILDIRKKHSGSTLADLYDAITMPPDLRKAHHALDLAIDRLYRKEPFANDRERVEHLFAIYEKLTAPVLAAAAHKTGRAKKKAKGV